MAKCTGVSEIDIGHCAQECWNPIWLPQQRLCQTGRHAHTLAHTHSASVGEGEAALSWLPRTNSKLLLLSLLLVVVSAGEWWVGAQLSESSKTGILGDRSESALSQSKQVESETESNLWDLLIFHSSLWQIFVMAVTTMDEDSSQPLLTTGPAEVHSTQPDGVLYENLYKMFLK